jgi:hypothetical protein
MAKRINHGDAAIRETAKAGLDAFSVFMPKVGEARHAMGAVSHTAKAIDHTTRAAKQLIRKTKSNLRKQLGLKSSKRNRLSRRR